jgi:hypothetical protein
MVTSRLDEGNEEPPAPGESVLERDLRPHPDSAGSSGRDGSWDTDRDVRLVPDAAADEGGEA